jgi:hypothetical protein
MVEVIQADKIAVEWLAQQLLDWPDKRTAEDKTMNIGSLLKMASETLLAQYQELAAHRLSAYAPDKVTQEVKEAAARAMRDCLEVTWHDTHGNDATICKDSIDDAAQSALLAAFSALRGDDNEPD